MLSKVNKSLITGLSVMLLVSLNCGMCTCAYSKEDLKQMIVDYGKCKDMEVSCTYSCQDTKMV